MGWQSGRLAPSTLLALIMEEYMNAIMFKREPQEDGRVFITTRALRMEETVYVERGPQEIVNADTDLLANGGWQPGDESKEKIATLVRMGHSLDDAFWKVYDEGNR